MNKKWILQWLIWGIIPFGNTLLPDGYGLGSNLYAQGEKPEQSPGFWEQFRTVLKKKETLGKPQESVTEKYDLYYNWIHEDESLFYDSLSQLGVVDWDKYQNIIRVDTESPKDSSKLARNIRVFGWYPYWMGTAYKDFKFNLLSYVAWFSYNIDPTNGKCTSPDVIALWKSPGTKEFIDLAHAQGCKVLLTISSHTEDGNFSFLKNSAAQKTLMDSVLNMLLLWGGDGVDVNFENVPNGLETEMTAFLSALSQGLKAKIPNAVLSVDLPAVYRPKQYQLNKLDHIVDLFLVTGYDYTYSGSKADGPVAPLDVTTGQKSIVTSIRTYVKAGLKREKLFLGLPYYGAIWTAKSPGARQVDSTLRFRRHITYRDIMARYGSQAPEYDRQQWSGYYIQYNKDSSYYEKCWFDDTLTLGRKMDWIIEENLAGVGIWALGYDNGRTELWSLIANKFAADTTLVYSEPIIESRYYNLSRSLLEFRPLIAIAGIFMVVFLLAGLIVALFDWKVREVFYQNKTLRLLYSFAGIGIVLSVFAFYLYANGKPVLENNNMLALGIGLTLGVCLTLYISNRYQKSIDKLP
jgi:spore germination protein